MADFEHVYTVKVDTKDAQKSLKDTDKFVVQIDQHIKVVNKDVEKTDKGFDDLNRTVKKTGISVSQLRTGFANVGSTLTKMSAGIIGLGGLGVRNMMALNEQMANVSTLLSGGPEQVKKYRGEIQEMAVDMGRGTGDLAEGLYEVISALGESTDNMDQLAIAARAATAGGGGTSTIGAFQMLSAVTKGYGDTSAKAMEKVSDLAFLTVKLGQTTFPELAANMGSVVPMSRALNVSQEELFGTMATLTGVTGNTAEVTTQLASVYSAFIRPSEKMTALAKKNHFESSVAMVKNIGLAKSIALLVKETKGDEKALGQLLPRKEALIATLALTGGQADVYSEKLAAMAGYANATNDAFEKQTHGINEQGHSWEVTKARMEVFSQRIGDRLLPVVDRLMDGLEPLIEYLETMSDETAESWMQLGKWVLYATAAVKATEKLLGAVEALQGLKKLNDGLSTATKGMEDLGGAAKTSLGTVGKLGAALGALSVGLALGEAINDIFIEPRRKAFHESQDVAESAIETAATMEKVGTSEQQEKALADLTKQRETYKEKYEANWAGGALEGAVAALSGDVSPDKRYYENLAEIQKKEASLKKSISATRAWETFESGKAFQSEEGQYPQSMMLPEEYKGRSAESMRAFEAFRARTPLQPIPGAQAPRNITTGDFNLTINGGDTSERTVSAASEGMKKMKREFAAEVERLSNGTSPASF